MGPTSTALRLLRICVTLLRHAAPGAARALRRRSWSPLAGSLCRAFEQLGPAFIKAGQFLSVRPDLIAPDALAEFERLQDSASPIPFARIADTLEAELLAPPPELFRTIDPRPLATASLSQVHRAELVDGTAVAVKVQRPGADTLLQSDLQLLGQLLRWLVPLTPLRARLDPAALSREILAAARAELDFRTEGERAERFRRNFRRLPGLRVPRVYWTHTSRRVLTTEFITGVKISAPANRRRDDYAHLAELGARAFLQQVLDDGLFHADLHPANLLITPAGEIAYLDFGIVGQLTADEREAILGALAGMLGRDPHLALRNLARLGVEVPASETAGFTRAIAQVMDAAVGPRLEDISVARIGRGILAAVHRHRVRFPRRHALLIKALLTIEGSARMLHPTFSFEGAARKHFLDKTRKELCWSRALEVAWRASALAGLTAVCASAPTARDGSGRRRSSHG